jgi:hypothetical protein
MEFISEVGGGELEAEGSRRRIHGSDIVGSRPGADMRYFKYNLYRTGSPLLCLITLHAQIVSLCGWGRV